MAESDSAKILVDDVNKVRINLLNYVEQLKAISSRIENCKTSVNNNLSGFGKGEIIAKFDSILEQFPVVVSNVNNYSVALGKVIGSYQEQDADLAKFITTNIEKIDDGR